MKLYSLGRTSSAPCLVLQFKGASIMLDCSLDVSTLQHFMPLSLVNNKPEGVRVTFFPRNIYVNSERTSQLKPWTTRELQDIEGFSAQNNLKEIGGKVFIDEEPEICPPEDCLLDISTIDIILISNYHFMLALPFITEVSLTIIQDSKEKSMPLNQQFRLEGKNCADLCGVQRG
ncbi:hypothetical protein pdam_00004322 [Pocillopora damicornis]|uniref:Uncharacterized protein n=1 Tax=Pocillopora damicornis TaxID=46731 RepID=A0A3M6T8L9_POCDA|nr:hypothetical protein pdam_00004322 [Pocillopora damicornis]